MRNRSIIIDVVLKRFVRPSRIPAVHPPSFSPTSKSRSRESRKALGLLDNPQINVGVRPSANKSWERVSLAVLFLLFTALIPTAQAAVSEVGAINLTVRDLNRELSFFTNTLPFELLGVSEKSGADSDALYDLPGARVRVAELRLGREHVALIEHISDPGRPIPTDSRSYDHWFQHIAIVVRDMDAAYTQLRLARVKHVSTGPQTLPEWNKNASGIKAFYFRDPEDHVLEIISFPPGKGDPKWQRPGTNIFLGIDHTAIVVSDTDKSLAFYRDLLGFRVAGESENYGVEQEHLNQVFGARLHITGLRAEHGPGIEFLEYLAPPDGRAIPVDTKANDLIFWNTHLVVDDVAAMSAKLRAGGASFVSKPDGSRSQIVRDPDGHAMELDAVSAAATAPFRP